jgi:molecular chaperone DnaJ
MTNSNHYDTLDIHVAATQAEIKQAYRRLVKQYHPDTNQTIGNHDRIATINAAYEVLGDPQQRHRYDRQLTHQKGTDVDFGDIRRDRQSRTTAAQDRHRHRQTGQASDEHFQLWLNQVYQPVNRLLGQILNPLQDQIDDLAADPFDDQLLDEFSLYLEDCRNFLQKAQSTFRSMPNPASAAGVAAHLYYCLNQVSDGIDELEWFTTSYNEHYLHTGQELFRIANGLRREAQVTLRAIPV